MVSKKPTASIPSGSSTVMPQLLPHTYPTQALPYHLASNMSPVDSLSGYDSSSPPVYWASSSKSPDDTPDTTPEPQTPGTSGTQAPRKPGDYTGLNPRQKLIARIEDGIEWPGIKIRPYSGNTKFNCLMPRDDSSPCLNNGDAGFSITEGDDRCVTRHIETHLKEHRPVESQALTTCRLCSTTLARPDSLTRHCLSKRHKTKAAERDAAMRAQAANEASHQPVQVPPQGSNPVLPLPQQPGPGHPHRGSHTRATRRYNPIGRPSHSNDLAHANDSLRAYIDRQYHIGAVVGHSSAPPQMHPQPSSSQLHPPVGRDGSLSFLDTSFHTAYSWNHNLAAPAEMQPWNSLTAPTELLSLAPPVQASYQPVDYTTASSAQQWPENITQSSSLGDISQDILYSL